MRTRRAAAVLSLLVATATLVPGGAVPAHARSPNRQIGMEEAEADRDTAYRIVDASVADRDRIEQELFDTLQLYEEAAADLAAANGELDRLGRSVVFADATAAELDHSIDTGAAAAYMSAVVQLPTIVLGTQSVEKALIISHAFRTEHERLVSDLDRLLLQLSELETLQDRYRAERDRVETLGSRLTERSQRLEALFSMANADVAAAFARAQAADVEYRAAVTDLDRARAETDSTPESGDSDQSGGQVPETSTSTTSTSAAPSTTTTTPPTTIGEPATTTTTGDPPTTTTTTSAAPSLQVSARTRAWSSIVSRHFPASQVENALVIIECESGGGETAVNPYSGAAGLFQFLPATWAVASVEAGVGDASPLDGEANIAAAAWLSGYYASRGEGPWRPWGCRRYL